MSGIPAHLVEAYKEKTPKSRAEFERVAPLIPQGSPSGLGFIQYPYEVFTERGEGAYVWDIDGNEYIDLRMGYGPVILGHGDDRVDDGRLVRRARRRPRGRGGCRRGRRCPRRRWRRCQ